MNIYCRSHAWIVLITALFSIFLLVRCAHQGSLSGGPKDEAPPEPVKAEPPGRSLEFTASRITITFNEFIQLKDPAKEIFISPPMKTRPEFKVQGKNLIVEFRDELRPNSTYTINFGNSVTDFTEGNPLSNFEYVFSTGKVIDSLWIAGRVVNAFNLKPETGILAMVFRDDNDTLPLDSLPLHVPPGSASRTDKEGKFRINNLAPGTYKLFALQDLNNNFYFDLPNEQIGFTDSLVVLEAPRSDTALEMKQDSAGESGYMIQVINEDLKELYLFEETDSTQKLLSKKNIGANRLQYIFRMPTDSISVSLVGITPARPDWYLPEFSKNKDTIDLWLFPGLPDTIRVRVCEGENIIDTTRFYLTKAAKPTKQKKADTEFVKFIPSSRAGTLDLERQLTLTFPGPLAGFDTSKMFLRSAFDSIPPSAAYRDSLQRIVVIQHAWKPGESYKIIVDDSAFTDLAGHVNDSTVIAFKVRSPEDYGLLIVSAWIPADKGQFIIQLMDPKENILDERIIVQPALIRFDHIFPGKYKLKAIHDRNADGRWSTGKYNLNRLPERVFYYPDEIEIRANWDLQEEWKLEPE